MLGYITKNYWYKKYEYLSSPQKWRQLSLPISDNKIKADIFNRFFCAQTLVNDEKIELPKEDNTSEICTLSEIVITTQDVQDILQTLDTSKATWPDCITPTLLKQASLAIAEPLCKFYNLSLHNSLTLTLTSQVNGK